MKNKTYLGNSSRNFENMAMWNFLYHRLRNDLHIDCELDYSGRPESASPVVGSYKISIQQQKKLVKDAFV